MQRMRRIRPEVSYYAAAGIGFENCLFLRGRSRGGFLEAVGPAEFLAEAFDASGRIHEFLLAGKEWMALAADVDVDLGKRAAGGKRVSAGAMDAAGLITRVDFGFHGKTPWPGRAFGGSPDVSRGSIHSVPGPQNQR